MGKVMTEEGLIKDLDYIIHGTYVHGFLSSFQGSIGMKVLEAGCGSGKLGLSFTILGADVTLLDIDPDAIAYAKELLRRMERLLPTILHIQPHFDQGSVYAMTYPDNSFDFCFSEGVPHHWSDWRRQKSIDEMVRVTKPQGRVCIIGSNALSPEMMDYAERVSHTYPDMPPKQTPFTPQELEARMTRAGLSGLQTSPVPRNVAWKETTLLAGWGIKL